MKSMTLAFLLVLLITGCTIQRRLYSPTQADNPSLKTKNDYTVNLSYSAPSGFDFNGGYALTNRWAITGGAHSYKNKDQEESYYLFSTTKDSSSLIYTSKGFHVGTGIYFPLSKIQPSVFLSFFAGYNNGNFEMQETLYSNTGSGAAQSNFFKSNLNRWFLQGNFNFYSDVIHQSFITRLIRAGYSNVSTDYTNNQQTSFNLPPIAYPKWSTFLDFSFDTKIFISRDRRIGLQLFATTTTRLNRKDYNFYIYPFRAGIGIVLKSPLQKATSKK